MSDQSTGSDDRSRRLARLAGMFVALVGAAVAYGVRRTNDAQGKS